MTIQNLTKTFDNYDLRFNGHHGQVEIIKKFGKSEFKQLLIFGQSGRGKTHLVQALSNKAGLMDYGLKYTPKIKVVMAEEFYFTILKSAYGLPVNDFFCSKWDFDELMYASKAIVIDDLGKEKQEAEGKENFNNLDKYRGKIIITTNLNRKDIYERYGEFIGKRLFDENITQTIVLGGKDYRTEKK
jgi:DNA replication protein DnaC